jgi:hypothetical protein
MATIHYPLTSVTGHAFHTAGHVAWAVITRLAAIAALALAAGAAAGLVDQGPLAGVLPAWSALTVMGSILVVGVMSIAALGASDTSGETELFDVR